MSEINLRGQRFEQILSPEQIADRVAAMAQEIEAASTGLDLHCLVVLRGSFVFAADLIRHLSGWPQVDFVQVRSYQGQESTTVQEQLPIPSNLGGKAVLLLDDILETGKTLKALDQQVKAQGPAWFGTAVLLDKPDKHDSDLNADFAGFDIGPDFVIGYGLDWDGLGRHLPGIYAQRDA